MATECGKCFRTWDEVRAGKASHQVDMVGDPRKA